MIWFRFLGSEHRAAQRALTDSNARVVSQVNRLAIKRGMIKTLVDNGFNNKTGCEHSFSTMAAGAGAVLTPASLQRAQHVFAAW
jgi:hypothetical protein